MKGGGRLIVVGGNIGVGKSTLLETIGEHFEPVERSTKGGEENQPPTQRDTTRITPVPPLLNGREDGRVFVYPESPPKELRVAFYSDPKQFGFVFQIFMLSKRLYEMSEATLRARYEGRYVFFDRSIVGDACFALINYLSGNINQQEMTIYRDIMHERKYLETVNQVETYLYMFARPRQCYERTTRVRKFPGEEGIPLKYFVGIDDMHFYMLLFLVKEGHLRSLCAMDWTEFHKPQEITAHLLPALFHGTLRTPRVRFVTEKELAELQTSNIEHLLDGEDASVREEILSEDWLLSFGSFQDNVTKTVVFDWNKHLNRTHDYPQLSPDTLFHSLDFKEWVWLTLSRFYNIAFIVREADRSLLALLPFNMFT